MLHTMPRPVALILVLLGLSPAAAVAQQAAPANPYYEFLQARRLEGEGDSQKALEALLRAAAADPASAEIKAEIAALYDRRDPPNRFEAEKFAREALAIDEHNVEANRTLGYIYVKSVDGAGRTPSSQQEVRSAILHLERASAGTVGVDLQMEYHLGRMYLRNSEPQKAVQTISRVVAQNPTNPNARQLLATAYAAAGDLKGAIATLDEVIEYLPSLAASLARYLEQDGQFREAAAAYTVALAQSPGDRQLKAQRIAALYNAKDFAAAARFAAEARKQHPEEPNFPRLQARALFDAGDRNAAIAVAESAAKTFPKDAQTQFGLVDLYSDAGRSGDAEKFLRQMLANSPSDPRVLNHLGYLLATRGDQLDEAVTLVRRALQADPDRPEYLDSLGWAHFKRGELNDALKYLSAAAQQLPDNSEIQDHLGDVHARRGSFQEAIAAWTRALAGSGQGIEKAAVEKKISDAKVRMQNAK
jgi:tetratricopeptide (TPR) repeat protein